MKQRSQFKAGFFSGMAAALSVVILVSVVFMVIAAGKQYGVIEDDKETVSVEESGGITATVNKKLKEIQDYVDYYYIFDYDEQAVVDKVLKGYVEGLGDKYSAYYTKEEMVDINESMSGEYYGIGVMVSQVDEGALIMQVFDDSPALEAGLKEGDIIIVVEDVSVSGVDLDNIVSMIRGMEGESVRLSVSRDGEKLDFEVERRAVQTQTVTYRMLDADTGYINLSQFEEVSARQVEKALTVLTEQGMKKLVLDIRANPGGLLTSVNDIADLFLPSGKIVLQTKSKQGLERVYKTDQPQTFDGEIVLLVNEYSASASEVLASSLQDNGRAKLVGTTTFGKGIVQTYFSLTDGTVLKITTENYYTANGHDIHGKGIEPAYPVELNAETEDDEQLLKALELLGSSLEETE